MLHIINKSTFQTSTLDSCLGMAQDGSAVLLIEDGVYAATLGSAAETKLRQACQRLKVYALQPDLDARGLSSRLIERIELIDYGGFVDLTLEHSVSHSWL